MPFIKPLSKQNLVRLISCSPVSEYLLKRFKATIDRSITDQGAIFKHGGIQANHGTPYQAAVNVEKNMSANPTPRVLQRIEDQKQLRIDLEREDSGEFFLSLIS
jgi:hypothetical protein